MLQFNNLFSIYIHLRLAVTNTRRSKQTKKKYRARMRARTNNRENGVTYVFSLV